MLVTFLAKIIHKCLVVIWHNVTVLSTLVISIFCFTDWAFCWYNPDTFLLWSNILIEPLCIIFLIWITKVFRESSWMAEKALNFFMLILTARTCEFESISSTRYCPTFFPRTPSLQKQHKNSRLSCSHVKQKRGIKSCCEFLFRQNLLQLVHYSNQEMRYRCNRNKHHSYHTLTNCFIKPSCTCNVGRMMLSRPISVVRSWCWFSPPQQALHAWPRVFHRQRIESWVLDMTTLLP